MRTTALVILAACLAVGALAGILQARQGEDFPDQLQVPPARDGDRVEYLVLQDHPYSLPPDTPPIPTLDGKWLVEGAATYHIRAGALRDDAIGGRHVAVLDSNGQFTGASSRNAAIQNGSYDARFDGFVVWRSQQRAFVDLESGRPVEEAHDGTAVIIKEADAMVWFPWAFYQGSLPRLGQELDQTNPMFGRFMDHMYSGGGESGPTVVVERRAWVGQQGRVGGEPALAIHELIKANLEGWPDEWAEREETVVWMTAKSPYPVLVDIHRHEPDPNAPWPDRVERWVQHGFEPGGDPIPTGPLEPGVQAATPPEEPPADSPDMVRVSSPLVVVPEGFRMPPVAVATATSLSLLTLALAGYFWPTLKLAATKAGLAVGLYTKLLKSELLDHALRDRLMEIIQAEPGMNASEIQRRTGTTWGTLVYHLSVLERHRLVSSLVDGRDRRYFPAGAVDWSRRGQLALLHHERARALYDLISEEPGLHQGALAARLNLGRPTALWHLGRLEESGLIARVREGRRVRYVANPAPTPPPAPTMEVA